MGGTIYLTHSPIAVSFFKIPTLGVRFGLAALWLMLLALLVLVSLLLTIMVGSSTYLTGR